MKPKLASEIEIPELRKLSTEKLIIWIVGKSEEAGLRLTPEDTVLECWLINPKSIRFEAIVNFPVLEPF